MTPSPFPASLALMTRRVPPVGSGLLDGILRAGLWSLLAQSPQVQPTPSLICLYCESAYDGWTVTQYENVTATKV